MAKINGFETIYYRNSGPKSKVDSYFGRYLESINHNFKYKHLKNKKINDNLYKFIKKNNLLKKLNSNKKFLILLHDYSLHDSRGAYKGSTKGILNSAKKLQNTSEELSLSLTEELNHQEKTLEQQVKLLDSVAYWYAGPSFLANIVFIIGLKNPADYNWINSIAQEFLPLTTNAKIITIIGLAIFNLFVIWMNKKAVKNGIQPILENIKMVQLQLKNDE